MDDVLHRINSDCISLSKDAERRNNRVLNDVVTAIVERMQQQDRLFAELYQEIFYGGSYYDDLKVAKPDEYDLDLVMRFPEDLRCRLVESDCPGFVRLRIDNPQLLGHNFQVKLMEGCYLSAQKLSDWMEALIHSILRTAGDYTLTARMIRPAMILVVTDVYKRTILTVDLVPCFRFDFDKLPGSKWRSNPVRSSKTFSSCPNVRRIPITYLTWIGDYPSRSKSEN